MLTYHLTCGLGLFFPTFLFIYCFPSNLVLVYVRNMSNNEISCAYHFYLVLQSCSLSVVLYFHYIN